MKSMLASLTVFTGVCASLSAQTLSNYQATVTGQNPAYYFKLDGGLTDAIGGSETLSVFGITGGFSPDAFRNETNAYSYLNGGDALLANTDLITGGGTETNAAAVGQGSITLLFRALDDVPTGQRFIFSQGNTTTSGNALGLFVENNTSTSGDHGALKLRLGNETTTLLTSNNFAYAGWYFFAMTYDEARDAGEVQWYLGRFGQPLASGVIDLADDAVIGDDGFVYVGNQSSLSGAFRSPGKGRLDEFAIWNRELTGMEITNQFANLPNPFPTNAVYQDVIVAQQPAYHFKLDNSLVDSIGGSLTLSTNGETGAFTTDAFGNADSAYSLNETNDALFTTTDIINGGGPGADTTATGVGTVTFLFRMLSDTNNTGQRYLFAQPGSSPNRNQLGLFLESTNVANGNPNSLKLRVGNGPTTSILQPEQLIPDAWYFFAMSHDEARNNNPGEVKWYVGPIGGALVTGAIDIGNDAVVGDNGLFAFGNRDTLTNSAFRGPGSGAVDELAVWADELAPDEILAQFNSLTNVAAPAPTLEITLAGANVILSWPTNGSAGFALESATSLPATLWTGAGSPTVIGDRNYVTNSLSGSQRYYRLKK